MGLRSLDEAIGHVELLDVAPRSTTGRRAGSTCPRCCTVPAARRRVRGAPAPATGQDHGLDQALDNTLIARPRRPWRDGTPVRLEVAVRNENRSVGAMLGGEVVRRHGGAGLPDDTIEVTLRGTAGQSFGAFVPRE